MGFSFSKLFNKTETTEDTIEAIMSSVEHQPLGISEKNVIYSGPNELGGYFLLQTAIIGTLKVKCKNGAKLTFKGNNLDLTLNSDSLEFESHHTETKGRFVTNIDFQIEKSELKKLEKLKITEIILLVKNKEIVFTKVNEKK